MNLKIYFNLIVLLFLASACSKIVITEPPVVSWNNDNVLQPKISFTTTSRDSVRIEFWRTDQPNVVRKSTASFGTTHSIVILNVTPETHYSFQITSLKKKRNSDVFEFQTKEIPDRLVKIKKFNADSSVFNGYILLRRFFRQGVDMIMNNTGELVWYHEYDTSVRRAFSFTNRHSIISISDTSSVVETNLFGETINRIDFSLSSTPQFVHHEIILDSDSNIVAIKSDSMRFDLRGTGGERDVYVKGSGIIRTSINGEILWEWNVLNHVDVNLVVKALDNPNSIVGHSNSIAIDKDGNYLLSLRDFSQIWKIDSKNGNVLWKLGKGGDFTMPEESYFIKQHSIHFNPIGDLMMFDNGEFKTRQTSRVLTLKIDEENFIVQPTQIITLPKELTSYRMCSAFMINADKYLVCTTRKDATIAVVNSKAEILWKVTTDNASYRAYYIEDPFGEEN